MRYWVCDTKSHFPCMRNLAVLIVLATSLITGCSNPTDELVGNWVQSEGSRPGTRLIFNEDATGKLDVQGGISYQIDSWAVEGDEYIAYEIFGGEGRVRFDVNKDNLDISRATDFGEMNGRYTRQQ